MNDIILILFSMLSALPMLFTIISCIEGNIKNIIIGMIVTPLFLIFLWSTYGKLFPQHSEMYKCIDSCRNECRINYEN